MHYLPIKFGHNHTIRTLHWILVLSVETWSDTRAVYRYFPPHAGFILNSSTVRLQYRNMFLVSLVTGRRRVNVFTWDIRKLIIHSHISCSQISRETCFGLPLVYTFLIGGLPSLEFMGWVASVFSNCSLWLYNKEVKEKRFWGFKQSKSNFYKGK